MRVILYSALIVAATLGSQPGLAQTTLLPSTAFTIRDSEPVPTDGIPETITDAPIFIGQVTGSSAIPSNSFVEETFFEYDLGTLTTPVRSAVLNLQVFYSDFENGTGKRISYSSYSGSGAPNLSVWGIGTLLAEIPLPTFPNPGQRFTFQIDVSNHLKEAFLRGVSFFGVRAHNALTAPDSPIPNTPTQVAHGNGTGLFPQTLIVELIPEPSSFFLFSTFGLFVVIGFRSRKRTS